MTAAAMMVSCGKKQPKTPEPAKPTEQVERIDTTATLVMQIQKCSRLYTTWIITSRPCINTVQIRVCTPRSIRCTRL